MAAKKGCKGKGGKVPKGMKGEKKAPKKGEMPW